MRPPEADHDGWDLFVSPWHLDEHIKGFLCPSGAVALDGKLDPAATGLGNLIGRFRGVADTVARWGRPLVLAGDCLTALGVVAGVQRRHRDLSVVWLDAHGDFNTPAISVSGYLAGMSLAMLAGRASEVVSARIGMRPVLDDRIILVDARDLDPAEREALDASRVKRVPADPQAVRQALDARPVGDLYLHLDVDIVDGDELPGFRWATSSGPSLAVVEECVAQIVCAAPPVAACIACPWAPDRIASASARSAVKRLTAAMGADVN